MCPVISSKPRASAALLLGGFPLDTQRLVETLESAPAFDFVGQQVSTLDELDTALKAQTWDLVLCDFELFVPDPAGVMARIQTSQPQAGVILVSRSGTIRDAVDMMRLGACGFVEWADQARLIDLVRQELEVRRLAHRSTDVQPAEARYQNIVDEQTELICRYDADFRLTFVNRAYSEWQGMSPAALIGVRFIDQIPAADREHALANVKALCVEQPTTTSVHPTLMPDGTELFIEWTDHALFDDTGRFLEYQGVGRDITERIHTERALQRYAQRIDILHQIDQELLRGGSTQSLAELTLRHLRTLIPCQRATVAIFDAQLTEGVIFALDVTGETALPLGMRIPIRPSTFEGLDSRHMRVIDDIRPMASFHPEARQLADEGLVSGLQVLLMEQDRPIGQLGLLADTPGFFAAEYQSIAAEVANQLAIVIRQMQLSEALARSHAELEQRVIERTAELQAANDRLTTILNNSHDGILLVDGDLSILQSNPAFDQLLPVTLAELPTRSLLNYFDDENAARVRSGAERAFADQRAFHTEIVAKRRDGTAIDVELGLSSIPGDGLVVTVHDFTERKQVERQLRYHASVQENMTDAVIATDMDLHIQSWNKAAERIYGWRESEVLGRVSSEIVRSDFPSPEDQQRAFEKLLAEGWWQTEIRQRRKDGSSLYVLGSVTVVKDEDGQPQGIIAVNRDITERKQAEDALRTSEARYRLLAENIEDIIMRFSMDRRITYFSPSCQKLLGYTPEEVVGRSHSDFIHPDDYPSVIERTRQAVIAGEHSYTNVFRLRHKAGHYIWYEVHTRIIREYDTGKVIDFVSVLRDITKRKQAEDALRTSEIRYRLLAENVTDLIIRQDLNGKYLYVSPSSRMIIGYSPEEMVGRSGLDDIHPDDRSQLLKMVDSISVKPLPSSQVMFRFRHKDGHYIWLESSGQVIFSPDTGEPTEIVSSARDVTARKQTEDALLERMKAEQAFEESLKTLHEITLALTPITDLDTFYQNVVEWGVSRLGFDRLGLFLADPSTGEAIGTYGTDSQGKLKAEHDLRFVPGAAGIMGRALRSSDRFCLDENTSLRGSAAEIVGAGWNAAVILWNGCQSLGWLVADNLIRQEPASASLLSLLSLYASTVSNLLAEKQTRHALQQSEARYRQLFENNAAVKFLMDRRTGAIIDVNSAAAEYYGYPLDVLKTMNIRDINVMSADELARKMETAWRGEQGVFEVRHRLANGEIRDIAVSTGPMVIQGQELLFSIITDITERKLAENALKASEAKFRQLVETMRSGLVMADEQERVTYVNDRLCEMLGYDRDELVGKNMYDYVDAENAAIMLQYSLNDPQAGGFAYELTLKRRDGVDINLLVSGSGLFDSDQKNIGAVAVLTDITLQKQAEQALHKALQEEKTLGELKSRFVSMTSHEFRNPLAAIMASAETLMRYRDRMDKVQIDARLDKIQQLVEHLDSIVEDVLHLSRIQSGYAEFKPESGNLSALCGEIVDDFESQNVHQGRVRYACPASPVQFAYDGRLMRQTIINLVSNALKYSPVEKPVYLTLSSDSAQARLTVVDQGIGIPAEDLKYLFEPFHRASNVGTISGTGLGLSIAKQAVELHGGTISVESQVEAGTTFTIHIPLREAQ